MRTPLISLALCLSALLLAPIAQAETATLQHDNSGNVTQRSTPQGTATYTYDALNRVQTETQQPATGTAKTQTLTYDENGNRLSDGAGSYTYETSSNRMSTRLGLAVTFDAAGNLTADGTGKTFTYNQANQLYQVFQGGILLATYTYDFTGLRIAKVTTASAPQGAQTVIYEYDEQEHLISELSGTGAALRSYVWRENAPVAQIEYIPSRKVLSFDPDHLNTPRAAMDETGKVVWRWESDAFGTTAPDEDPDKDGNKTTINLRFPGQYYDVESGLHYNGHRYYSPLLRIYTQADRLDVVRQSVNPLYRQYSEPTDLRQGLNQAFTYVGGNPLSYTDPTGLTPTGAAVGGRIGWWLGGIAGEAIDPAGGGIPGAAIGGLAGRLLGDAISNAISGSDSSASSGSGSGAGAGSKSDGNSCSAPPPDKKSCEVLRQSILNTCAGLTGKAKFRCFAAANTAYRQCMGYE